MHLQLKPLLPVLITLLFCGGYQASHAQLIGRLTDKSEAEAGVTFGFMNSVSDIMGNKNIYQGPFAGVTLRKSKYTFGLYGGLSFNNKWGLRLEANTGWVEGFDSLNADAKAPSAYGRFERNLNFRSRIREIGLVSHWNVQELFSRNNTGEQRFLTPYLLAGFNWFSFNPQGYTANGWVDLQPLRLEGQGFAEYPTRKIYKLHSWAYSIGGGISLNVSPSVNLRLEILKRTGFTDYIDDVHEADWVDPSLFFNYLSPSQAALATQLYNRSTIINPPRNTRPRGHPNENDAYWTGTLKLGWKFAQSGKSNYYYNGSGQRVNPKGALRQVRCSNM